MVFQKFVLNSCAIMTPNFKFSKLGFLALWTQVLSARNEPMYLIKLMKKIETGHTPSKDFFTFIENFVECQERKWSRLLCVDIVYTWAAQQSRGRINVNN